MNFSLLKNGKGKFSFPFNYTSTPYSFRNRSFEYANDLAFWYGSSYGNPAQSAIGLGWVQEWLARVTESPIVNFDSSTNSSYHTEDYFPLKGSIFVDATHDTSTLHFTLIFFDSDQD